MHQRPALSSITETYRACFTRLRILDSTSFLLPTDYGEDYQGSVSSGAKIQFEYELLSGTCLQLCVQQANDSDARFAYHTQHTILPNDLCIRDLGFFHSPRWRRSMLEVLIILPGCVPISKSISNRTGSGTNGIGNR